MRQEYLAIVNAGLTLQLDCPDLAATELIVQGRTQRELHVEALNEAVRDIPPERMRAHVCWGNSPGPHQTDVPLRELIGTILKARPQALLLAAANPRHAHDWAVFEDVRLPAGKVLVPGVIDTCTNFIEDPQLVAERLVRYARLVGADNLMAGTDCGFATVAGLHTVDPDIAWGKLNALVEGARLASEQL